VNALVEKVLSNGFAHAKELKNKKLENAVILKLAAKPTLRVTTVL
jgi:hypothetical protein